MTVISVADESVSVLVKEGIANTERTCALMNVFQISAFFLPIWDVSEPKVSLFGTNITSPKNFQSAPTVPYLHSLPALSPIAPHVSELN